MDNKKAAELAEKELKKEEEDKQIKLIKEVIKQTLNKLEVKKEKKSKLEKEIKILKQDIDNIRAGRLDLIAERQEKDDEAKKTSIIEVVKEVHHHHYHDRWYEPYRVIIKEPYWTTYTYCGNAITDTVGDYTVYSAPDWTTSINCSIAKDAFAGTYKLDSGDCITLT